MDEIVLCKVTKIFPSSVFVDLLEYGRSAIVHISEVSPGRIRNLRDFVSIGRQIVCKVLRIDTQRGHIDLSLRRVNSSQRREKLDEIKAELKAEQLLKNLAKKLDEPLGKIYRSVSEKVFQEYSHLHLCFKDIVSGDANLQKLGLPKNLADELTQAIIDKFKPARVRIFGEISLQTYHSDGLERIKTTLIEIEKLSPTITISYLGAGHYKLIIEDEDYKPAEKTVYQVEQTLEKFNDKLSTASFEREKND